MINHIKEVMTSYNFVFILITLGFIIVVALLILENRRDNMKLRLLNDKIKSLIAGEYSDIIDLQGGPELTEISNNINDLSEVIRLTHENFGARNQALDQYSFLYDRWGLSDQSSRTDYSGNEWLPNTQ